MSVRTAKSRLRASADGSQTLEMGFQAFGVPFRLCAHDESILEKLLAHLPPGSREIAPEPGPIRFTVSAEQLTGANVGFHILAGEKMVGAAASIAELCERFESLVQLHVAENSPDRVFVHAGVVEWRGRALMLPGRSFWGKTTLVAELLRAGAKYFSDEYALLDERGWVYPYPRRLSVRRSNGRSRCTPAELGADYAAEPMPVALVAFVRYDPEAAWRPRTLTPGQALLALLQHTVPIRRTPERALAALDPVSVKAKSLCSLRGEATATARMILAELSNQGGIDV